MQIKLLLGIATGFLIFCLVAVANATSFTDNFNDGDMSGWTGKIGSWSVGPDNTLSNSASVYGVIWKDNSFGVYQKIQVDAFFDFSSDQDDQIAHLRLRTNNHIGATQPFWDTGYLADFQKNKLSIYNTYMNGNPQIASFVFSGTPFDYSGWYELSFSVDGTGSDTLLKAWVNGVKYIDQTYNNNITDLDSGYVGLGRKIRYDNVLGYSSSTPVPEPATMLLFGTGIVGLIGTRIRRSKKR